MSHAGEGRGILDTNTVILLPQLSDPDALPSKSLITAITLAELSVGPLAAVTQAEKVQRQIQLDQAEADFDVIPFDRAAARSFATVSYNLRKAGKKALARSYDALIAATAIANDLPLYTTNPQDFTAIDGLQPVPVPHPDQTLPDTAL